MPKHTAFNWHRFNAQHETGDPNARSNHWRYGGVISADILGRDPATNTCIGQGVVGTSECGIRFFRNF